MESAYGKRKIRDTFIQIKVQVRKEDFNLFELESKRYYNNICLFYFYLFVR